MGEFSGQVISLFNLSKRAAKEQGGLLSGKDPSGYNKDDPIRLWIIQVGIIIGMASFLGLLLKRIRQPKVIAEVLGGIILGPTAFGRIPGFTEHVFPEESRSYLNLVANIGLCLFLFLVGLEIEGAIIKRNARLSMMIALAGMVIPFALGVGMAVPIYKHFVDDSIKFTHFMLFVGVAFSITAFPVLCRILTELKLLDTTVGIVVLSAGVANDIIGWVLLALTVALVNAGSGLMALYILLCCVGWTLFLLFPVRWGLHWLAVKTGSIETGPTTVFMTITILIVFGSAFFTDIIGVHAIFGAFVAGLIVPREGHLNITLTEKLEDMVSIIFLPLYFTLSGLSTDLGLLNNGMTWGYTIAICVVAFTAKFGGCSLAARFAAGFNWREASTIGSLMSCKGLIELIVLNVGLSAHILSQRVFSMFVLEALVLTFMTTPLCTTFYPPQFRVRATAVGGVFGAVTDPEDNKPKRSQDFHKRSFTVVLDKLEHVPSMMAMTQLIRAPPNVIADDKSSGTKAAERSRVSVEALRLIELSDRTSAVMKSWAAETILQTDPILGIFKMFGLLNDLPITPALSIVPYDELSHSVAEHARAWGSDMIIVPWLPPHPTAPFHAEEQHPKAVSDAATPSARSNNPFDMIWKGQSGAGGNTGSSSDTTSASAIHSQFVRGVFVQATVDVALFVDQTGVLMPNSQASDMQHLFLPFFGGPDDRLALDFVAQCCENPRITATVVKILKVDAPDGEEDKEVTEHFTVASAANGIPDTVYGAASTETRLQSDTADNIIWAKYTTPVTTGPQTIPTSTLDRMSFHELSSPTPLHTAVVQAHATESHGARKLVVVGRSRRMAVESHTKELRELISEKGKTHVAGEVMKTIGDVGTAFVVSGSESGIVVIQAAATREG